MVVTDNSTKSYAVFTYQCDLIQWSGLDPIYAKIGVSFGEGYEAVHPLSGSASANEIDCIMNSTSSSGIVNLIYNLNPTQSTEMPVPSQPAIDVSQTPARVLTSELIIDAYHSELVSSTAEVLSILPSDINEVSGSLLPLMISIQASMTAELLPTVAPCKYLNKSYPRSTLLHNGGQGACPI